MKIILPMAGNGSRFFEAGYDQLKPLIDVNGKPMFVRVLENIKHGTDVHVIIRQEHDVKYNLAHRIYKSCPTATVHVLTEETDGAATTVMKAIDGESLTGFLVANCDQLMVWDKDNFYTNLNGSAGCILTFIPNHDKPIHSYVTLDSDGCVTELAEKRMISNIATVGVYYFKSQMSFKVAYRRMVQANDRTNGEFYLAPVYNYLQDRITTYQVDEFLGLGTPEELDQLKKSKWWDRLDEI